MLLLLLLHGGNRCYWCCRSALARTALLSSRACTGPLHCTSPRCSAIRSSGENRSESLKCEVKSNQGLKERGGTKRKNKLLLTPNSHSPPLLVSDAPAGNSREVKLHPPPQQAVLPPAALLSCEPSALPGAFLCRLNLNVNSPVVKHWASFSCLQNKTTFFILILNPSTSHTWVVLDPDKAGSQQKNFSKSRRLTAVMGYNSYIMETEFRLNKYRLV